MLFRITETIVFNLRQSCAIGRRLGPMTLPMGALKIAARGHGFANADAGAFEQVKWCARPPIFDKFNPGD